MSKHVVIAAGGTGGHLFPAQALASELSNCCITFMAKGLSNNPRYYKQYPSYDITASGISLRACIDIPKGIFQSIKILRSLKPDLVVGFGSFHTFPVLAASAILRIPYILHEANRQPGKVNRLLAPFAALCGIYFPDTKLKGKLVKTDIPLRAGFLSKPSKEQALFRYGLKPGVKTVLVFGGSLGAKNLNRLAARALTEVNEPIQVIHFTGNPESKDEVQSYYHTAKITAFVAEFESEMTYAWSACDLVICRAGASTIAEQLSYAVPAIYIPYPQAADKHQDHNAAFVAKEIKGASMFQERDLTPALFAHEIAKLLQPEMQKRYSENLVSQQSFMQGVSFFSVVENALTKG
jgi:UDP-N-acetylglucosamine--N-acetylmuramyl-(pentapeptide) pyrophosphoryl-undecaprenol N-acetylglucosamine transferase